MQEQQSLRLSILKALSEITLSLHSYSFSDSTQPDKRRQILGPRPQKLFAIGEKALEGLGSPYFLDVDAEMS